jgi:cytidine deaminase
VSISKEYIYKCLQAREKAILTKTSPTKVGALLYDSYGNTYEGFNIQNRCHKSYHAEEIAILNSILSCCDKSKLSGMIVSFNDTIERVTFCCGHCRQLIWEYTMNPDFIITEVDLKGNIVDKRTIKELYPNPYPR